MLILPKLQIFIEKHHDLKSLKCVTGENLPTVGKILLQQLGSFFSHVSDVAIFAVH